MRLKERELIHADLVKRIARTGALGSCPEAFSEERIPFRASRLDESGNLEASRRGLMSGRKVRLLTGCKLQVSPGDGVYLDGDFYTVLAVKKWTAHIELVCGAKV